MNKKPMKKTEDIKEYMRKWKEDNREKCREYQREYQREYRKTEKCRKYQRGYQHGYRKTEKYKEYENTEERKEYQKEYQRKYQKTRMKEDPAYRKKKLAAIKASVTLKRRNICEICYKSPTQFHHEDYDKPLEVVELCVKCHRLLHRQYKEQNINLNNNPYNLLKKEINSLRESKYFAQ